MGRTKPGAAVVLPVRYISDISASARLLAIEITDRQKPLANDCDAIGECSVRGVLMRMMLMVRIDDIL